MHSKQSLYIRKNSSFLAAAGTSQIVLRLDDTTLVKSVYARGERNKLSHYVLMNGYEPGRIKAERILKELGLNVPNHIYVSNNPEPNSGVWGKERYDFRLLDDELYEGYHGSALFLLTKDLTENGKYVVKEFEENTLNNIDNKKQLMEEYKAFYNILYNIRFQDNSNNKYLLTGNGHTMESGDISGAINHLFLLKINPNTNIGELVAEDTNHIDIWCNPKFKS